MPTPTIPETITVHLGRPDEQVANVRVPFIDYVKNVASSEIYPTWPENALRANIYAQISFALNRIFTEYYRSRGYDFDITNSTQFDQSYVPDRNVFESISNIVDEIFNSYIVRGDSVEPYFAQYCDGVRVTCSGLEQWGTVGLAESGLTPLQILRSYYGQDISIVSNVRVEDIPPSLPDIPLALGFASDDVRNVQIRLNRISKNYPSIPKIAPLDGFFGVETENAVKRFQEIFNLTPDGIVGPATWYQILQIYSGVKKLNELNSEGIKLSEISQQYPERLTEGITGQGVSMLQYFLDYISTFEQTIPSVTVDGIYGPQTTAAVRAFQTFYGLPVTGDVNDITWNSILNAYYGIVSTIPLDYTVGFTVPFQGILLRVGSESESVRLMQEYLNYISNTYTDIPKVPVTGYFGALTYNAVEAFQRIFAVPTDNPGEVSSVTWDAIVDVYDDLYAGSLTSPGQYPGYDIS